MQRHHPQPGLREANCSQQQQASTPLCDIVCPTRQGPMDSASNGRGEPVLCANVHELRQPFAEVRAQHAAMGWARPLPGSSI